MEQISLYYPMVEPPADWLRQSLLLAERLSSIVPPGFEPLHGDLLWLENSGYYSGTEVHWFGALGRYLSEIEAALETFAANPELTVGRNDRQGTPNVMRLALGKLDRSIEQSLLEKRLASRRGRGGLIVDQRVGAIVLAVTARYIAENHQNLDSVVIPSTSSSTSAVMAYGALQDRPVKVEAFELILQGFIPRVPATVPLADVIAFRERYRDELLSLRRHIDEMVERVRVSEDPMGQIRKIRRTIEADLTDIHRAARSRGLQFMAGTLGLMGVVSASKIGPTDGVRWFFDGIGTVAAAYVMSSPIRQSAEQSPYTYLLSAETLA